MLRGMSKKATSSAGRDSGLTIRVPLEILTALREKAADVPRSPLMTDDEVVARLAHRALAIGAESSKLIPKS
jgi:hypothetical protein